MSRLITTALAGLLALSAAGCAVEVPMSALRMGPPDNAKKTDTAPRQDLKHIAID